MHSLAAPKATSQCRVVPPPVGAADVSLERRTLGLQRWIVVFEHAPGDIHCDISVA